MKINATSYNLVKSKVIISICLLILSLQFVSINSYSQFTTLLEFGSTGSSPTESLISDGTFLYGATPFGGTSLGGTVFKIKPDGTGYVTILNFHPVTHGSSPGSLIYDGTFLYGITTGGGAASVGTLFKMKPDGTGFLRLHEFDGASTGSTPSSIIYDGIFLYGMTRQGGINDDGIIFKILPNGTGYVKLMDFADVSTGRKPFGALLSDGSFLYGMTSEGGVNDLGTIFKIKSDGSGYQKLLDFSSPNGYGPYGSLISDGTFLYGMTIGGGLNSLGTIFKIKLDGTGYTKLFDFGVATGHSPLGSLISDGGFLYGLTNLGGSANGTIFKIKPDGTGFVKLFEFLGTTGTNARGSLISVGSFLYGMTANGGTGNSGTIFKYSNAPASCVSASERNALIALYNSTDGANWTNNSGWLSADESTWFGVTVTGCDVTRIDLANNNLTGALPAEIGDLSALVELNLSHNKLSGSLPSSLATCAALEIIDLEDNLLTGAIPTYFNTFNNLYSINLGFNQFSGSVPSQLGSIPPLEFLSLASNQLTGSIPAGLGSLINLTHLDLSRNQLSGSIPTSLGSMPLLNSLQLWNNQLTGSIPTQLGTIGTLQYLNLSNNLLTGSIPNSLGSLSNLLSLELNQNQLSGTIPNLGSTSLAVLKLSDNMITGSIPTTLSTLSGLVQLDLDRNQLTGILPPQLGLLVNLEDLNLYSNQLSGSLPIEYGNLIKLLRFRINDNTISGSVPIEYLAWNDIEILKLDNNLLDDIPTFSAPGITELAVESNNLDFADLEPNISVLGFTYSPQADLPGGFANTTAGSPLTIPFTANGTANQYQWYKDGVLLTGATSPTFSIASASLSDAGNYIVSTTSTLVTGITLNSLLFVVTIDPLLAITLQPVDISVCEGTAAVFTCAATGANNITYQWQFSPNSSPPTFTDISNGTNYSGATTATLSVSTAGNFGEGRYRCRINGDLTSQVITNDEGLFINPKPTTPSTTGNSVCGTGVVTLNATGGTTGQYRWYTVATGGTSIAGEVNSSYTTPSISSTTTFYVSINNGTCESARTAVVATVNSTVTAPTTTNSSLCGPGVVTLTASGGTNGQYRWYDVATGGTALIGEVNSSYTTPSISATTNYYVSINNGTCESTRTSVVATINSTITPPTTTGGSSCGTGVVTLTASGGTTGQYRWYDVATGGTALAGEVNSSYVTPSISTTTTYYVAINNGTCESSRSPVVAIINTVPAKPIVTTSGSTTLCPSQSVTLSAPVGFTYSWSTGATSQQIIVSSAGSFTVQVTSSGCTSVSSDPIVVSVGVCNQPPVIAATTVQGGVEGSVTIKLTSLLSDPDNNLDLSTLRIIQQPKSGAQATINSNNELSINYQGLSFAGIDELTIEICDLNGECAQQKITIEVIGDILVYNAISPNSDNKNPAFILKYIEAIEETRNNKVSIFNRWGDLVWEGVNYNNTSVVFTGSNKNGNELPTGTYFYKIEFASGRKTDSGYLSLKR